VLDALHQEAGDGRGQHVGGVQEGADGGRLAAGLQPAHGGDDRRLAPGGVAVADGQRRQHGAHLVAERGAGIGGAFRHGHERLEGHVVGQGDAAVHEQGTQPGGDRRQHDVVDGAARLVAGGPDGVERGAHPRQAPLVADRDVQRGARGHHSPADHGGEATHDLCGRLDGGTGVARGGQGGPGGLERSAQPRPHGVTDRWGGRGRGSVDDAGGGIGVRRLGRSGGGRSGAAAGGVPGWSSGTATSRTSAGVDVEEDRSEVDTADAVDQGVVHAFEQADPATGEAGGEVKLPGRVVQVEETGVGLLRRPAERVVVAGWWQRDLVDVAGDVEVGIVDPAGPVEPRGARHDALAEARHLVEPLLDQRAQLGQPQPAVGVEQRAPVEDRDGGDVDGVARLLEPQEAALEGAQLVRGHGATSCSCPAAPCPARAKASSRADSTRSASTSGRGTAARSQATATQARSTCDSRVTLKAAPVGGAKAHIRSMRAPPT
jgi:hypothetical protein